MIGQIIAEWNTPRNPHLDPEQCHWEAYAS